MVPRSWREAGWASDGERGAGAAWAGRGGRVAIGRNVISSIGRVAGGRAGGGVDAVGVLDGRRGGETVVFGRCFRRRGAGD